MKTNTILFLVLTKTLTCWGTSAPPFASALGAIDRVVQATGAVADRSAAMRLLEHLALGQFDEGDRAILKTLGINTSDLNTQAFHKSEVRAYAFRRMGETPLPEALEFLSQRNSAEFVSDPPGQLWQTVRVALYRYRMDEMGNTGAQVGFLEKSLTGGPVAVRGCPENQLCELGSEASLPLVNKWLRSAFSGDYAETQFEFCEARVRALKNDPDEIRSLAAVLRNDHYQPDRRLFSWAVSRLAGLRDPAAQLQLTRFSQSIHRAHSESELFDLYGGVLQQLNDALRSPLKGGPEPRK